MKTAMLITVAMALTICMAPAYCQGGPGGPPPPPPAAIQPPPSADRIDGIANALSLTTDQASALRTLLTTIDTTMQPLMTAVGDTRKALHDAFAAADFVSAADLATAASNAELAVTKASLTAWSDIQASGILTADQFTQLLAGPGPGGPPPGGPGQGPSNGSGSTSSSRGRRR